MKFIQLFSTIASLAIFAAAPGVSAAGLRAAGGDAVDKGDEAEASGKRSLYVKQERYGEPETVEGMPGPENDNVVPGIQGATANFDDGDEDEYYNNMYNHGNGRAYAYTSDGDYEESYRGRRNLQGEEASGRRKLYVKDVGPIVGPINTPGMPGMPGMNGGPGVPVNFNDGDEDEFYNNMYNHGRGRADAYYNRGESYYYNRKYNHGHNGGGHNGYRYHGY